MVFPELEQARQLPAQAVPIHWESVYTELMPRVFNYFRYHGLEDALAEDLTALTFEKAWRKRESYRHDMAAFSTWVLRIAHNVAMDHFRRRTQEFTHNAQASPEEQLLEQDDLARLRKLLAQLPPREQELVALKYGSGQTNRAIAQLTGLSETNVGTILYRVVNHLRERWEK
jgi:RNA polymerase sigma-70 factor (ECF subfamily)